VNGHAAPLRATSIGIEAQRALGAAVRGEVAAVFRNSFYVRFGDDWACFGSAAIGRGPLNVPLGGALPDWRSAVDVGSPASARRGALDLPGYAIALDDAPVWAPGVHPSSNCDSRADGLSALSQWLPATLPTGGLAALLRQHIPPLTCVEKTAWPAVDVLSSWAALPVEDNTPPPLPAVLALLGLGPGLTPSGDDFLAGFAVALRAVGKGARATALARVIGGNEHLTSDLSAAHLRAAISCGLSENLDKLLGALLMGRREAIEADIGRLCADSHYSPWDALAGIVTVLRGVH
jgi:hypothetical protein